MGGIVECIQTLSPEISEWLSAKIIFITIGDDYQCEYENMTKGNRGEERQKKTYHAVTSHDYFCGHV